MHFKSFQPLKSTPFKLFNNCSAYDVTSQINFILQCASSALTRILQFLILIYQTSSLLHYQLSLAIAHSSCLEPLRKALHGIPETSLSLAIHLFRGFQRQLVIHCFFRWPTIVLSLFQKMNGPQFNIRFFVSIIPWPVLLYLYGLLISRSFD